jgi:hypothetical protein
MIHSANHKVVAELGTGTTASSGTATLTIDRLDYDQASISVLRASNSNTVFASILKVQESDDNSTYTDVTALVGGGTGGFTIPAVPASGTSSTSVLKIDVDCRARKRYLKVLVTPATACNVAIEARLARPHASPATATEAGCIGLVNV